MYVPFLMIFLSGFVIRIKLVSSNELGNTLLFNFLEGKKIDIIITLNVW